MGEQDYLIPDVNMPQLARDGWRSLHGTRLLCREMGNARWSLKEMDGGGTVCLQLAAGGDAFMSMHKYVNTMSKEDNAWMVPFCAYSGIEVGHAHGMEAAAFVVERLHEPVSEWGVPDTAGKILATTGFTLEHVMSARDGRPETQVYRMDTSGGMLTIMFSKVCLDMDYQADGLMHWCNLLRLEDFERPVFPVGSEAEAASGYLRNMDLSARKSAAIAVRLVAWLSANGFPDLT